MAIKNLNRKSNFAKLNTEELFKSVDTDNSGTISEEEWLNFWTSVLRSGHTEEEISDEVIILKLNNIVGKYRIWFIMG